MKAGKKMAKKAIEAYEVECDGCEKSALVTGTDVLPVGWYSGTVDYRDSATTSMTGEWTACGTRCIRKAVDNVLADAGPAEAE